MSTVLDQASRQWASRPADQRFLTLEELRAATNVRHEESWTLTARPGRGELQVQAIDDDQLVINAYNPTTGQNVDLEPTNWAFGQLAQYARAPANYLRKLPNVIAGINLQYGLEHMPMRDETLMLAHTNGSDGLRAMTSTKYGRIWDYEVVDAVMRANANNRWKIPAASYSTTNPRRATTLYASDRDVFIFLVDEDNPIQIGDETLFRGFMTWNSEVGSAVFGLATFLYRYVCDNRLIWGATNVNELRIRHTGGAPERFAYEGSQYLARYAEESTYETVAQIKRAQAYELGETASATESITSDTGWNGWLRKRGFTAEQSKGAINSAIREEGQARSLWDIIQGVTSYARGIQHTDSRVTLERQAGDLMKVVSNR